MGGSSSRQTTPAPVTDTHQQQSSLQVPSTPAATNQVSYRDDIVPALMAFFREYLLKIKISLQMNQNN
jgi:hypothetical protein